MNLKNDLVLRAAKKQPVERTPIWIMRQAGRYLPEYRKIREKVSFLKLCKTPDLAAEVTIQPIETIGVDAAIIFSDILVVPEAMGMKVIIEESKGPILPNPINNKSSIKKLGRIDPEKDLKYVLDAIRITKRTLNGQVPLIGFSGSPWTLLTYMVEGKISKNFNAVKSFIFNYPTLAHQVLELITQCVIDYLDAQIKAGADLVQIFDSWAGILTPHHFNEFSLCYISEITKAIKSRNNAPVIIFSKGANHSLRRFKDTECDVVGIDWTIDISEARILLGNNITIQGNLDPSVLLGSKKLIEKEAMQILLSAKNFEGHIFNLGHGIYPETNHENLKYLVDYVKKESAKIRKERSQK
jgi:uroporphyrinogen decarboxylase